VTAAVGAPFARRIDGALRKVERFCSEVSALMLGVMMLIVVADVGFRYILNAPLVWSFDVITLYLTVGLFFFALSDTLQDNGHVWVDVVVARVPPRVQHLFFAIGYGVSLIAFAAIGWMAALRGYGSFVNNEVTAGVLKMPVWASSAFVTVGVAVLICRLAYRTFGHAAAALTGEPLIALPGEHQVHPGTE
jgi:TRAP-type C4-dicarboxylate transport system permease small subunit